MFPSNFLEEYSTVKRKTVFIQDIQKQCRLLLGLDGFAKVSFLCEAHVAKELRVHALQSAESGCLRLLQTISVSLVVLVVCRVIL